MKKYLWGLGLCLILASCDETLDYVKGQRTEGQGPVQTDNRVLSGFHSIDSDISADVFIKQSPTFGVRIEGQRNIVALLETTVSNQILHISFKPNTSISYNEPLKIYIEAPDFQHLNLGGSGLIQADSGLSGSQLALNIDGSGDIILKSCQYKSILNRISGSGSIQIWGQTDSLDALISGSGDVTADGLQAKIVKARIEGSGGIKCFATEWLDAGISGSGDIRYKGSPKMSSNIDGSGSVQAQ